MRKPTDVSEPPDERLLGRRIAAVRSAVKEWCQRHELWHDCGFKVEHEYFSEPPTSPTLTLIWSDGPLAEALDGGDDELYDEFCDLVTDLGCWWERETSGLFSIWPTDPSEQSSVLRLLRLDWIRNLARQRLVDIHTEVFSHFAAHPEDLTRLSWREFEVVLDGVFRNRGFRTELGPGGNDQGIDIRLYQSDGISELVTLVQAKRYRHRPINLDTVAALSGIVDTERAHRGLVVATSRFLPGANRFARLKSKRVVLARSDDIATWCGEISESMSRFLRTGDLSQSRMLRRPESMTGPLTGRVVHAHVGVTMINNDFCRVVAETPYEVVLEQLKTRTNPPRAQEGTEVPIVSDRSDPAAHRFIAFRGKDATFWGERHLYSLWDGKPAYFSHLD